MASSKRERELARAKHERQSSRRTIRRKRQQRNGIIAGAVGLAVVLVVVLMIVRPDPAPIAADTPTATPTATPPSAPVPTPTDVTCTDVTPVVQSKTYSKPEDQHLKAGSEISFNTNCGQIKVALDVQAAPKTSNAIAFLASSGWYNNNLCHRLTTDGIYVVQCGSPTMNGQGGAGFTLKDENLPTASGSSSVIYPAGTVAMANSGPNTGSSQFFIIYKDSPLGPNYSQFGHVTSGMNVVEYIAANGVESGAANPSDGKPAQPLVIKTATVRNGP